MVKDPRPHKTGSSEPDEALELLRALARSRGSQSPPPERGPAAPPQGEEKLDALRALAEKLDLQLRSSPSEAAGPAASPPPSPFPLPPPPFGPPPFAPPPRPPFPPLELKEDAPARDPWLARAREALRREWRALVAALPDTASLVPRFGRTQFVFIGISVGVLLIAAIGTIVGVRSPQSPTQAPSANQAAAPPAQVVPPIAPTVEPTDLAAITREMSDCDAEAVKDPDALYFLVLPLLPAKAAENDWRSLALQEVGNSFLLLSAKDALDGLRDGKLAVRPGRYTFSVLDPASGATYSWTSATRISRLSRKAPAEVKALKLGFDFSAAQTGGQWTTEFKRDRGTCYWVSVLVRQ